MCFYEITDVGVYQHSKVSFDLALAQLDSFFTWYRFDSYLMI